VAEIIEARDITARDQDGWTISYGVRRSDDREVPVLASCSRPAEASIRSDDARGRRDDLGRLTLEESLALTALVAKRAPERRSRFEVRWLPRLLEEDGQ